MSLLRIVEGERDQALAERDALQARVEEAETKVGVLRDCLSSQDVARYDFERLYRKGRTMPADTFFEWMQARYVRDIWEERIARLKALAEEWQSEAMMWERKLADSEALAERRKEVLERHFPESLGHRADGERECHYCRSLVSLDPHKPECPRAAIEEEGA